MCKFNTLKNNTEGYVLHCKDCNRIKIAFATTLLVLTNNQFQELLQNAHDLHLRYKNDPLQNRKMIVVSTPSPSISMIFTPREVASFYQLLNDSNQKLRYKDLFAFCDN